MVDCALEGEAACGRAGCAEGGDEEGGAGWVERGPGAGVWGQDWDEG